MLSLEKLSSEPEGQAVRSAEEHREDGHGPVLEEGQELASPRHHHFHFHQYQQRKRPPGQNSKSRSTRTQIEILVQEAVPELSGMMLGKMSKS